MACGIHPNKRSHPVLSNSNSNENFFGDVCLDLELTHAGCFCYSPWTAVNIRPGSAVTDQELSSLDA